MSAYVSTLLQRHFSHVRISKRLNIMSHNIIKHTFGHGCADLDQPAHLRSLIRIFTQCNSDSKGCKVSHADNEDCDQISDVQADFSLLWAIM